MKMATGDDSNSTVTPRQVVKIKRKLDVIVMQWGCVIVRVPIAFAIKQVAITAGPNVIASHEAFNYTDDTGIVL